MRIELKKTNFFTEWVVPILIALVLAFSLGYLLTNYVIDFLNL